MVDDKYIIIKPFNHNVVYCRCKSSNSECIVIGKGIGFQAKPGQSIDANYVEKVMHIFDEAAVKKFNILINKIDSSIIGITEEIIKLVSLHLNSELNENSHITLLDHINFAIIRYKSSIEILNPFLFEIKSMYKKEFEAAKKALDLINSRLKINLPEDEAGFIAMHIHAALNNMPVSYAAETASIISSSIKYIEDVLNVKINKDSIQYIRLITHIRFAVDRARKKISIQNLLIDTIKEKYKNSYNIADDLSKMLKDEYSIEFTEGEIGYIALHLQSIINDII